MLAWKCGRSPGNIQGTAHRHSLQPMAGTRFQLGQNNQLHPSFGWGSTSGSPHLLDPSCPISFTHNQTYLFSYSLTNIVSDLVRDTIGHDELY